MPKPEWPKELPSIYDDGGESMRILRMQHHYCMNVASMSNVPQDVITTVDVALMKAGCGMKIEE